MSSNDDQVFFISVFNDPLIEFTLPLSFVEVNLFNDTTPSSLPLCLTQSYCLPTCIYCRALPGRLYERQSICPPRKHAAHSFVNVKWVSAWLAVISVNMRMMITMRRRSRMMRLMVSLSPSS